jgi:eukaryotic-like serine/threonine-protein kinase
MQDLGRSYQEAGRLPEAIGLLEQAWAVARKQTDPVAGDLAWTPFELGKAYERAGQFAKAESLYCEALVLERQRHKEATSSSARNQASLAWSLLKQHRHPEAAPLLRESLSFREQKESDDYATFYTKSLLDASLLGQKKYAEAEPLLLAGYEGMKHREATIPQVRKFRVNEAIEQLVQLYEAT